LFKESVSPTIEGQASRATSTDIFKTRIQVTTRHSNDLMISMKISTIPSEPQKISRNQREAHFQQTGTILWFTGLSGSGKTTLSIALEQTLFQRNVLATILDGDVS